MSTPRVGVKAGRTFGAVAVLALTAACARSATPVTQPSPHLSQAGSAIPSTPIRVVYEDHENTSEGRYRAHAELIADGPDHVRYAISASGFAPIVFVYDAPKEHPDQYANVSNTFSTPGSVEFAKNCRSAKVVGHQKILGRPATGYHCAGKHDSDGSSMSAFVVWLDQATGVLLKAGPMHATRVEQNPHLTAATFDTNPPSGAKVEHYAARGGGTAGSKRAPSFHLRNVRDSDPRTVSLADYAHRPVVLAFFMSDLTFSNPTESPREFGSLRALKKLTSGGTDPVVLAIQGGDEGKPGDPLIPKGVSFTVVNDPGFDVQHAYGLGNQVGYAFVGSDGTVHQVFDNPPSEQQLRDALAKLK